MYIIDAGQKIAKNIESIKAMTTVDLSALKYTVPITSVTSIMIAPIA